MSDFTGAGTAIAGAATAAATIVVAKYQYDIQKEYSNRAEAVHKLNIKRFEDDISIWQNYARQCLINVVQADCNTPMPVEHFSEVEARATATIRIEYGAARKTMLESADIHGVGVRNAQITSLRMMEAAAAVDARAIARTREHARVKVEEGVVRQNKLQSIAVVRGNYNAAAAGLDALARLYDQTAASAAQGFGNSVAAGALVLGRLFNQPADRRVQRPAPIDDRGTPLTTTADDMRFPAPDTSYWDNPANNFVPPPDQPAQAGPAQPSPDFNDIAWDVSGDPFGNP